MANKEGQTGGVFEFGGAEQATKDAAATGEQETETTQESTETTVTDEGTNTNATEHTEESGQTEQTEVPEGTEVKEGQQQQTVQESPFEVDGRTFATRDELITAYKNSSSEGKRLDALVKERERMLAEREQKVLELEEKFAEQPFPGLLSTDKEQEAAQLDMLSTAKQTEYILAKREWEATQRAAKEQRVQQKAALEESTKSVRKVIENNEREMTTKVAEYPGFAELKPTREKIIELTPCIANRPETPYLSFWIAYGLDAFNKAEAAKKKGIEGKDAARQVAKSAQQQVGGGGAGKPTNASATSSESAIVRAYKERNGAGI